MISSTIKSGDWKGEKHVPVIKAPEKVKKGELIEVKLSVGEEIAHPNNYKHHIDWIKVFFQPQGKPAFEVGALSFSCHDEDNQIFSEPRGSVYFKAEVSETIHALSFCNIHGLWENEVGIVVE